MLIKIPADIIKYKIGRKTAKRSNNNTKDLIHRHYVA